VNVTPDKREIFLTQEALLLVKLKEKLQSMWGIHDHQRTFQVEREGGREEEQAEGGHKRCHLIFFQI